MADEARREKRHLHAEEDGVGEPGREKGTYAGIRLAACHRGYEESDEGQKREADGEQKEVGGVPLEVVHVWDGPGIAFSYQVAKSAAGGATTGAGWFTPMLIPSVRLL